MTRGEALAWVAGSMAAHLSAMTFEEAADIVDWEGGQALVSDGAGGLRRLSEADARRLEWAVEEVGSRLSRMGRREERGE